MSTLISGGALTLGERAFVVGTLVIAAVEGLLLVHLARPAYPWPVAAVVLLALTYSAASGLARAGIRRTGRSGPRG